MNLVTGASSGLGKFLCEQLPALAYSRNNPQASLKEIEQPFDAIIHSAFNVNRDINSKNFSQYINDNLNLTQQLLSIPHKKFIFISTADVYPRDTTIWKEEDEFSIEKVQGLYGLTKLIAETLVKNATKNYLILRPTALLGLYSRPNSLIKMLRGETNQLTLSADSTFNYILHQDVVEFIRIALNQDLYGTYNLSATGEMMLGEVAKQLNHEIKFGSYTYNVANICNQKATKISDVFSQSSLNNVKRFRAIMGV